MNPRLLFLLTALSGMIGMVSLIVLNLCRFWISRTSVAGLSDEGIDQLITITRIWTFAQPVTLVSISAFLVFFVLYLASRRSGKPPPPP